jgi:hypothetical protein
MIDRRAIALSSLLLSGCLSGAQFVTPRTLEPRQVSGTVGLSVFAVEDGGEIESFPVPIPAFGVRVGVAEGWDAGVQFIGPALLRFDVKHQLLAAGWLDLAAAGGAWITVFPSNSNGEDRNVLLGAELMLIAGLNAGDAFSFVPWIAPGYALEPTAPYGGLLLRTGGGFRFRMTESIVFTLLEVSSAFDPARPAFIDGSLGFGFSFGES